MSDPINEKLLHSTAVYLPAEQGEKVESYINQQGKNNDKALESHIGTSQKEIKFSDYNPFEKSSNPFYVIFHVLFKALAVANSILGGILFSAHTQYVLSILFASFDFWVTKNLTGRKLIKKRWWSEPHEDDTDKFIFECRLTEEDVAPFDYYAFWFVQWGFTLFWCVWCVIQTMSLNIIPAIFCIIQFCFLSTNTYAYYKCSEKQQAEIRALQNKAKEWGKEKAIGCILDQSVKMQMF